jgi:RNA polymerase sigma-70 factor (ECF subfamily)
MKIQDKQILDLVHNKNTLDVGFRLLLSTYQERLYHHIMTMVNCHEDTNDILQNTFIKVYKYIAKFENRSTLYTWMFRIATNETLSFLKKRSLKNNLFDNVVKEDIRMNEAIMDGDYIKRVLYKAIENLPVKQKKVFSLRYFEEMSYKDMSEVLDTSVGALKASYHHAVKKVEVYIQKVAE